MTAARAVPVLIVLFGALVIVGCSDGDDPTPTSTAAPPTSTQSPAASSTPGAEPTAAPQPTSATLTIEIPGELVAGSEFTATVRIDGVTDLGAYQLRPVFDESALRLISVQDGGFLGSSGRFPSCQLSATEGGLSTYYCVSAGTQPPGPSGSGVLATITLHALAPGAFELSLADVQVTTPNGTEAPVTVVGVIVTVR